MIYEFDGRRIDVQGDAWYVAPGAQVIGSVRLGRESSVWFAAVLRGDNDWIEVGDGTNVQDGTIIHTDAGAPTHIGRDVTIGHRALLHSCSVGDESLIANGAIVLDGARIGRHCMIAAGALVPPGRQIADRSVVMGAPGRVVREVTDADLERIVHSAAHYRARSALYRSALRVDPRSLGPG